MMQTNATDVELINSVLSGNTAHFALLVRRHQRYVFTMALRFAKNREDAEEIAQDCFLKAYKALPNYRQDSKFSTWLYRIVYTTAMSTHRKKQIQTIAIEGSTEHPDWEKQTQYLEPDNFERKNQHKYLNLAIDLLSPDDANLIMLFYKAEQSIEEIGEILDINANTIKVKLFRARQRLREKLQLLLKEELNEWL